MTFKPSTTKIEKKPALFSQKAQASWVKSDFDAVVWDKGYEVYHDKLIECPCKSNQGGNYLITCKNCRGTGRVLIERISTRMVLQGMNMETKFKPWTEDKIGMVKITGLENADFAHRDRIIIKKGESVYNELIYPDIREDKLFAWLCYESIKVDCAFLMINNQQNNKLIRLKEGTDFTIDGEKFFLSDEYFTIFNTQPSNSNNLLTNEVKNKFRISIKYYHRPQFTVIETQRDIINNWTLEGNSRTENVQYPTHAIGRRSHLFMDKQNFDTTYLNDNSTQ